MKKNKKTFMNFVFVTHGKKPLLEDHTTSEKVKSLVLDILLGNKVSITTLLIASNHIYMYLMSEDEINWNRVAEDIIEKVNNERIELSIPSDVPYVLSGEYLFTEDFLTANAIHDFVNWNGL